MISDAGGVLRLWDTHNSEHIAKLEQTVLGSVFDVAWSMDNSRVAVVGEGKERSVFTLVVMLYCCSYPVSCGW